VATENDPRLARARREEHEGRREAAAKLYFEAGAFQDSARMLMSLERYEEAGRVLLLAIGAEIDQLSGASATTRKHALSAAICFQRSGNVQKAVELFVALGENTRAIDALERAGDREGVRKLKEQLQRPSLATAPAAQQQQHSKTRIEAARRLESTGQLEQAVEAYMALLQYSDAARLAKRLGKLERAAELYLDAGQALEAAACFEALGDPAKQFDALVRVPRDDPRYRDAALLAIDRAAAMNLLDVRLEQFVTRFMQTAPETPREMEALYTLARLYLNHSFIENAREALSKIVSRDPGYREAKAELDQIEVELRGSPLAYDRIVREDLTFQRPALYDLPDLPPLPDLPQAAGSAETHGRTIHDPDLSRSTRSPFDSRGPLPMRTIAGTALPQGRAQPARFDPSISPPARRSSAPPPSRSSAPPPPGPERASAVRPQQLPGSRPRDEKLAPPPPVRPSIPPPPPLKAPSKDGLPPLLDAGFAEGAVIAERYELGHKIGRGGTAVVWSAKDRELGGAEIAMKVITQQIDDNSETLRRFKQELILSRRLNHRNILRLYDIGIHRGYRYITMELLVGSDLKSMIKEPMALDRGIELLVQACDGLQAVHDNGIIHRDIKPHNFFVTDKGELKIMDFGIAKANMAEGQTVAGMIAGTPTYIAPEQIDGFERVTPSADIYSLGVIAYEMFTGKLPFYAAEMMMVFLMQLKNKPQPPREVNPSIPEELERIILKLLEKKPENRYASCRELAEELEKLRS
jgi:eukaryotic-like serine/threonine-protein kinase